MWLGYRALWKALVVVTPVGEQTVELFADEDLTREFWLVPEGEGALPARGVRVGRGVTVGRGQSCELRLEAEAFAEEQLKVLPFRDWCSVEDLASQGYALDDQPTEGSALLKEGQCLKIGDLSIRLVRRPVG